MAEGRRLGAQRLEQLNLRRRVGDVIFAAHHMRCGSGVRASSVNSMPLMMSPR